MRPELFLCLDQGGSASRALVVSATGEVVATARAAIRTDRPAADRVEHDPRELAQSLRRAAADVIARLSPDQQARLVAAGLLSQRASLVCWDRESGEPLSPVLSWQDTRAREILAACGLPMAEIQRRTGLVPNPHLGASKYRWCLDELPAVAEAADRDRLAMGPLAAWLGFALLDERPLSVDPANAARTLLMDFATATWDPVLLSAFGLPAACLPTITPTAHAYGTLSSGALRLPLRLMNGDQSSAIFGFGPLAAGRAYLNIGTGAFLSLPFPRPPARPAPLLCSPCLWNDAPVYLLEGTVHGAAAALDWWAAERGGPATSAEQAAALRTAEPALFLNTVGGLGSPDWRDDLSPCFLGPAAEPAALAGVLESIVFLVRRNFERLQAHATLDCLLLSGGLGRLDGLAQRLADLCECTVLRPRDCEATALGAAFCLAGQPAAWSTLAGAQRFEPVPNTPLSERYHRWTGALDAALA